MTRYHAFAIVLLGMSLTTLAFAQSAEALVTPQLTPLEQLGKLLFFDENLSKYGISPVPPAMTQP